jgi:glycosyltransferase involved in cell wall biosynthesis
MQLLFVLTCVLPCSPVPPPLAPAPSQPALYEAFGLTVIEAMTCGLPTFATCNGGPSEIIKNAKSGFHIDPYHGAAVSGVSSLYCVAGNQRWCTYLRWG